MPVLSTVKQKQWSERTARADVRAKSCWNPSTFRHSKRCDELSALWRPFCHAHFVYGFCRKRLFVGPNGLYMSTESHLPTTNVQLWKPIGTWRLADILPRLIWVRPNKKWHIINKMLVYLKLHSFSISNRPILISSWSIFINIYNQHDANHLTLFRKSNTNSWDLKKDTQQ